ncbi:putative lipid phosphate phosphatase beta [Heracleum sosnowskyi]|uniref:Lipid phosphate phosphatase beta n=1 Tax=Heracleum sosnowskyi TaxID=360622 RepID=A0AAD8IC46_9APIA|nr:putative lipid phosphate phosphatase beta [Heracleum sosnowskyi]
MAPHPQQPQPSLLNRLTTLDKHLSLTLYTLTSSILPHSLLKLLEFLGDGRLFFPLILSTLAISSQLLPIYPFLVNLLIGSVLDLILIGSIKHIVQRPRPVYNKNMSLVFDVDHWSFPSGHSSRVCFIAGLVCLSDVGIVYLVYDFEMLKIGVCVWAGVTSISRVLLGRHYVFDVVVGACLGVFEAVAVICFLNYEKLASVWADGLSKKYKFWTTAKVWVLFGKNNWRMPDYALLYAK